MTTETTTATDVAVVRAGFEAFASGDIAGFADMFAPDATWNHRNDDRLGGIHQGSDGIMAFIGESAQLTAGTLRAEPQAIMGDGQGNVAVLVRVSATRPDGRAFENPADPALQGRGRPRPERRPVRRRPERRRRRSGPRDN